MPEQPKVVWEEFDRSVLIDIYLDGFGTGAGSAALQFPGVTTEFADQLVGAMCSALMNDPAAMEVIRNEVLDRLLKRNLDANPKNMTVFGKADES